MYFTNAWNFVFAQKTPVEEQSWEPYESDDWAVTIRTSSQAEFKEPTSLTHVG